jgi:RNA polymerase sigma-70 factor, ECF subfamily
MARVIIRKIDQEKMIRQLSEGNSSAFEQLFRLYFPRLRKYALSFLKEQAEAEDLVQEVFFQVWNSRTYLTPGKPLSSWLYTLVRNRASMP